MDLLSRAHIEDPELALILTSIFWFILLLVPVLIPHSPASQQRMDALQCRVNFFLDICHWVQFSSSVVSDCLRPHGLQHIRLPHPSPTPRVYLNSCPSSRWCHRTISTSVIPYSSRLQSFPASGSFQMSKFFASGGQSIAVSASTSVLPMNIQDWFTLGWTGWISLQSKGLSGVYFNPTVQKHKFFDTQLSL